MTPTPPSAEISPPLPDPVEGLPPITAARLKLGMSLNDLAQAAQIDPAHLELMERRSHFASPTLDELERLAAILQVGVDEIRGA
jgi:transcriptional regulator with XRE-family HTH domain